MNTPLSSSLTSDSSGVGRGGGAGVRLLVTAGPTHEPIDAVRFIGNRSSGRLGVSVATAGAEIGWSVTLLLGPIGPVPGELDSRVRVVRFRTTADLEGLLGAEFGGCDVLVMAAAVADYRPIVGGVAGGGKSGGGKSGGDAGGEKLRRTGERLVLELEPTPDLLAGCGRRRRLYQTLVGFALEPRDRLVASAEEKCRRKGVDVIVANPLETMESEGIEAWLVGPGGVVDQTSGVMGKGEFGGWLIGRVRDLHDRRRGELGGFGPGGGGGDGEVVNCESVAGRGGPMHG